MAQNQVTRVIVIGGSAGSLDVLLSIIQAIPANAGLLVIVIVHRKKDTEGLLTHLISTRTSLPVKEVEDKESIVPNAVYVAPPDYHLLVEDENTFSLDTAEKIHYSRPSIDVTFESVSEKFGQRAIGILLSGANADGAEGLGCIKAAGGITIAQDPVSADVGFMPQQAINLGIVDHVIDAVALPGFVRQLLV
jgi:two-component system chemotaxis response regulator CheB